MTDTPTTHPLSPRLRELSDAVPKLPESRSEWTMRVPAEPDRDADLVLSRAADELDRQAAEIARLRAALRRVNDQAEHFEREWYLRGDALEALEALRVDAERYRWLRDDQGRPHDRWPYKVVVKLPVGYSCAAELDAAIDAARKEGRSDD